MIQKIDTSYGMAGVEPGENALIGPMTPGYSSIPARTESQETVKEQFIMAYIQVKVARLLKPELNTQETIVRVVAVVLKKLRQVLMEVYNTTNVTLPTTKLHVDPLIEPVVHEYSKEG